MIFELFYITIGIGISLGTALMNDVINDVIEQIKEDQEIENQYNIWLDD
jgi:hypothetical protein